MKKVILKIDGMSCSACQNRVEKYLNQQDGVLASVNLVMAQALIEYDDERINLSDLERFVEESGYKSGGIYHESEDKRKDNTKFYLIMFLLLVVVLMYVSMSHMLHLPVVSFLDMNNYPVYYGIFLFVLTVPFIIFGFDIIKSGINKLFHKSPNMDTLVAIGVLASFSYSVFHLIFIILGEYELVRFLYFESSAMIIFFVKLGRFIDKRSKDKTKEAISELVQITPKSALLKEKDGEREVTIDEVNVGDILICKPGMRIAVDGVIVSGNTHLDESFINGESVPIKKRSGDRVVAGSINIDGYIEYKAERIGPDSTISEIVRLVVEAVNTKAPIGKFADVVSGYFVPAIIMIACFTFFVYLMLGYSISDSFVTFVAILVVACPCALGLATPLAIVVSEGKSAREGILIKTSEILENAHKVDTIVFDKTGILTYGDLRVSKVYNYSRYTERELLSIVAGLEHYSTHPISNAFQEFFDCKNEVMHFKNIAGIGIFGVVDEKEFYVGNYKLFKELELDNHYKEDEEVLVNDGNSILYVFENNKVIGLIGVMDIVRDNAKSTIKKLKEMDKDIIMLSGDNEKTARIIAGQIGIDKVIANVMPQEKEEKVKELMDSHHRVMMVGDGINDAPSLVSADIGVSINSGTDIAGDSADIILMDDDLSKIVRLLRISERTIRVIKQNLFWAFLYNALMIPVAMGLLKEYGISIQPMFAAMAMVISSLTVTINSLRLRK